MKVSLKVSSKQFRDNNFTSSFSYQPISFLRKKLHKCGSYLRDIIIFLCFVISSIKFTKYFRLTLALAIQRYIYVCHPNVATIWCTIANTKKAVGWIFIFAVLHQITRYFLIINKYSWFYFCLFLHSMLC